MVQIEEEFDTLHEVRNAIAEFLSDSKEAGMNYTTDDIEVIEYDLCSWQEFKVISSDFNKAAPTMNKAELDNA